MSRTPAAGAQHWRGVEDDAVGGQDAVLSLEVSDGAAQVGLALILGEQQAKALGDVDSHQFGEGCADLAARHDE